ncbi:hypothetical protein [Niallia taxi]|uniref:hypothetical protein n=1 Tax=Niallia taxi TaxID=2499688 RepID=UPI0015F5EE91|nr:hypothetical protein [Niallia taxi]
MYKEIEVRFEEVPNMIKSLKGVSGNYYLHTKGHYWYVGKAECFYTRFTQGYLKGRDAISYVNEGIKQRIEMGLDLSVIFVLIPKELIGIEEVIAIRKYCPWLNTNFNPRNSIRGIQRQIGQIVKDSQRQWSYEEMTKHLFYLWGGQLGTNRIEQALMNKNGDLSRYSKTVASQKILKPNNKLS